MTTKPCASCGANNESSSADESAEITLAPEPTESQPLAPRRSVLKAAALGATVAALVHKGPAGWHFGPLAAEAEDLSTFQCTAGDVQIIGAGQIIDEPCSCNTNFTATVRFHVINTANSERGCITVHLPDGRDIILNDGKPIPGKFDGTLTGQLTSVPCGTELVCFGSQDIDGRKRCEAGKCPTVSWTVPGQDPDVCPPERQISSKCRHQQICIRGRGGTTLECVDSCSVGCGGNVKLKLCTTEPDTFAPFTFKLEAPGFTTQTFGPTTDTCHTFEVGPITAASTTFTGTVTDSDTPPCAKSKQVTVTSTAVTVTLTGTPVANDCGGKVTFTASTGRTGCTFAYKVDGNAPPAGSVSGNTFNYDPTQLASIPTSGSVVTVDADCGGCKASACKTVCLTPKVDACPLPPGVSPESATKRGRGRKAPKRGATHRKGKARQKK
jgi:hypothetical protein